MTITSAFRYRVGADSIRYEDLYNSLPSLVNLKLDDFSTIPYEPLWIIFCAILKTFSSSFLLLQIVHAFFINSVFCIILFKHSKVPFISLFLYFFSIYFTFNFESIRESFSIAIFLLFFQKKHFVYWIGCFVCFFIHYGSFILFLLPLFKNFKLSYKSLFITCLSVLFIGSIILKMINNLNLDIFGNLLSYKLRTYSVDTNISIYYILLYFLLPFVFLFLGIKLKLTHLKYDYLVVIFFVLNMMSLFVPIFSRFSDFVLIFYIIYISNVIYKLINLHKNDSFRLVWAFFIIMLFSISPISWYFVGIANTSLRNYDRYLPYYSILSKKVSPDRELIAKVEFW